MDPAVDIKTKDVRSKVVDNQNEIIMRPIIISLSVIFFDVINV